MQHPFMSVHSTCEHRSHNIALNQLFVQPVGEAGERKLPTVGPDEAVIKLARQQIKSALAASREQASALLRKLADNFSELLPLLPETSIQVGDRMTLTLLSFRIILATLLVLFRGIGSVCHLK